MADQESEGSFKTANDFMAGLDLSGIQPVLNRENLEKLDKSLNYVGEILSKDQDTTSEEHKYLQ